MSGWRVLSGERRVTLCPVALLPRDEFSGGGVIGEPRVALDLEVNGEWIPTERKPTRTEGGVLAWPGLGRSADVAAAPMARVRVRMEMDHQIPIFRATDDGLEFDVPPYDDFTAPIASPIMPQTVLVLPGPSYPFSPNLRVLRGRVIDAGGEPVTHAIVMADGVERAMSGPGGAFSLPLRWQDPAGPVAIDVSHPRTGLTTAVSANLPADLTGSFDITVT